jgi:hypothetical protein
LAIGNISTFSHFHIDRAHFSFARFGFGNNRNKLQRQLFLFPAGNRPPILKPGAVAP